MRKKTILNLIILVISVSCQRADLYKVIPDCKPVELIYSFPNTFDEDLFSVYSTGLIEKTGVLLSYPQFEKDLNGKEIKKWREIKNDKEEGMLLYLLYSSCIVNENKNYKKYLMKLIYDVKFNKKKYMMTYSKEKRDYISRCYIFFPNENMLYFIDAFNVGLTDRESTEKYIDSLLRHEKAIPTL